MEVLLPEKVVTLDDIAKDPAHLQADPLGRFAGLVARNLLRQGVTLSSSPNVQAGIKVRLTELRHAPSCRQSGSDRLAGGPF